MFVHDDYVHNARLDSGLYGQRWMAETRFPTIKRRFGPAVWPSSWYREIQELVLTATVYNLAGTQQVIPTQYMGSIEQLSEYIPK